MSLLRKLMEIICALLARWGLWYCRRRDLVTPVITINGALVRPNEILVDIAFEDRIADQLRALGGRPYEPSRDGDDWRRHPLVPDHGDVNAQMDEARIGFHLWVGFSTRRAVRLVRRRELPGVHFNSVYLSQDGYYQGGPKDFATPSGAGSIPAHTGDSTAEVAVLDTGMPLNWQADYPSLANTVIDLGPDPDPLGTSNKVASHGAHGLFICGLIARVDSGLDIQSQRVMAVTGEVDDTKACPAIVLSAGNVVNLSFSGYTHNNVISPAMGNAVEEAVKNDDRVLVAAAGNDGGCVPGSAYHNRKSWPAAHPDVISVGAFDSKNSTLPSWTNQADVYAPGVNLLSLHAKGWEVPNPPAQTYQGWATWSGTSFATPVVAAKIATELAGGLGGSNTRHEAAISWVGALKFSTWPAKPGSPAPNGKILPTEDLTA